jgi:hypothetical protein
MPPCASQIASNLLSAWPLSSTARARLVPLPLPDRATEFQNATSEQQRAFLQILRGIDLIAQNR